jgi:hypothetical protein
MRDAALLLCGYRRLSLIFLFKQIVIINRTGRRITR